MTSTQSVGFTIRTERNLAAETGPDQIVSLENAWNIRFSHSTLGGFWSMGFHLRGDQAVEDWLDFGLGRHVELYDSDTELVFEGFINVVRANIGSYTLVRGPFLNIGNKVKVVYSFIDWDTGEPNYGNRNETDWAEDSESQERWGELHKVISLAGANPTRADDVRDLALEELKDPEIGEQRNIEHSAIPSVTMECLGYFHWLNTFTVDLTTTGEQDASDKLVAVLNEEPNGIFGLQTSIESNTNPVGAYDRSSREAISIVKALVALGDPSTATRWTFQFLKNRDAYFDSIPTSPLYQKRLRSQKQDVLLYEGGGIVPPWKVKSNNWLFYSDILVGMTDPVSYLDYRADPRYLFVESMEYREPWQLTLTGSRQIRLKQLLNQFGIGGFHT